MAQGYRKFGFGFELSFTDKASQQIGRTRQQIKGLKGDSGKMAADFNKQVDRIERRLEKSRLRVRDSMRLAAAGTAIIAPFALAAREAIQASDRWGDVATLLAAAGDQTDVIDQKLGRFQARVAEVGANIAVPIEEMEGAWYRLQSALGETGAIAGIEETAKLALATRGKMDQAVDATTSLMKTYGDAWGTSIDDATKFERIVNVLAGTVAAYNTDLGDLSEGMKWVVGRGSQMNIELEETAALIGTLQTRGLQGGRAGTSLDAFLRVLSRMPEMVGKVKRSLGGERKAATIGDLLGVTPAQSSAASKTVRALQQIKLADQAGKLRPVREILAEIEGAFGMTAAQAQKAAETIKKGGLSGEEAYAKFGIGVEEMSVLQKVFTEEGSRGLLMLLGQSRAIDDQVKKLKSSAVAQDMFNAKNRTAAADVQKMKNQLHSLTVDIGDQLLPVLVDLMGDFRDLTGWIRDFIDEHPNVAAWITKLTVMGGALAIVTGGFGALYFKIRAFRDLRALLMLQTQIAAVNGTTIATTGAVNRLSLAFKGLMKAAPFLLAAYGGYKAGKWVYENLLRGVLPGTEKRADYGEGFAGDVSRAIDAKRNFQTWLEDRSPETGKKMGTAFGSMLGKYTGPEAGAAFGAAQAKSYYEWEEKQAAKQRLRGLAPQQALAMQLGFVGDKRSWWQRAVDWGEEHRLTNLLGLTQTEGRYRYLIKGVEDFAPPGELPEERTRRQRLGAGIRVADPGASAPKWSATPTQVIVHQTNQFDIRASDRKGAEEVISIIAKKTKEAAELSLVAEN